VDLLRRLPEPCRDESDAEGQAMSAAYPGPATDADDRILVVSPAIRQVVREALLERLKREMRGREACIRWEISHTITDEVIERLGQLIAELAR
jgi:hypothetical protein